MADEKSTETAITPPLATHPPTYSFLDGTYYDDYDCFIFRVGNGRRLAIPRENLQYLKDATPKESAAFEIHTETNSVHWPELKAKYTLVDLYEGRYGDAAWMDHVHRRTTVAA